MVNCCISFKNVINNCVLIYLDFKVRLLSMFFQFCILSYFNHLKGIIKTIAQSSETLYECNLDFCIIINIFDKCALF